MKDETINKLLDNATVKKVDDRDDLDLYRVTINGLPTAYEIDTEASTAKEAKANCFDPLQRFVNMQGYLAKDIKGL